MKWNHSRQPELTWLITRKPSLKGIGKSIPQAEEETEEQIKAPKRKIEFQGNHVGRKPVQNNSGEIFGDGNVCATKMNDNRNRKGRKE